MPTITRIQRRGAVTIPQPLRDRLAWADGQMVVVDAPDADTLVLRRIPDARAFLAQYDALEGDQAALPARPRQLPLRWCDAATIAWAQADPAGPERAWLDRVSRGLERVELDPVVLGACLAWSGQYWPTADRATRARWAQALVAWPGLQIADRDLWLDALQQWGTQAGTWDEAVLAARQAADAGPLSSP